MMEKTLQIHILPTLVSVKYVLRKTDFFLNGEKIRFNGVCLHHDNGPMGAAVNVRADEKKASDYE